MADERLIEWFDAVVQLSSLERAAWLDAHCGDDADLRAKLMRLLEADALDGVLEDGPALLAEALAEDDEPPPGGFGVWRVLGRLGAGGMGEVWLAERDDAGFTQRAAIKRVAWPTPGLLQRFQRERQILARLEHPGIARLIDGGVDDAGRPYLVMEHVDGQRIDDWVREQRLDVREIIKLLLKVCDAVQFAHRNLVVHSDLKPSNMLVDAEGTPRLLDFGIAKVLSGEGAEATGTGARLMTPDYAAPELRERGSVTTAVDVYALGVLAYQLLAGVKPKRRAVGSDADAPVTAPSAALPADLADRRTRRRAMHGDLDRIVQMALAHDPARRYASVEAFAADLRRWLGGRAISARGDRAAYRLRKFIARNRIAVGAAALLVLTLVAATAYSLHQAQRANRQAVLAQRQAARAETVTHFLTDMFRFADPKGVPGGLHLTARQMLDAGAQRYEHELRTEPLLAAKFATTLATIYTTLGDYDRAIALASDALKQNDIEIAERARALAALARAQYEKGDYETAQASIDAARKLHVATHGKISAGVAADIALSGEIARRQGDYKRAESLTRQALAMSRQTLTAPDAQIAAELNQLAVLHGDMRRIEDARAPTQQALAMFRKLYGNNHLDVAENIVNLGVIDMQTGKVDEALRLFAEGEIIYHRLLPGDSPSLANVLTNHARALDRSGRYREAQTKYGQALAMQEKLLGDKHPDVATTLNNMAVVDLELGDAATAAKRFRRVLGIWAAQGKPDHPLAQISRLHLASALRAQGKTAESEALLRTARATATKTFGAAHPVTLLAGVELGASLRREKKTEQSLAIMREVDAAMKSAKRLQPLFTAKVELEYALSELESEHLDAARTRLKSASAEFAKLPEIDPIAQGRWLAVQAKVALAAGDREAGCKAAAQALDLANETFGVDSVPAQRAGAIGYGCVGL